MAEIAFIGDSEFTMGFELIGVKNIFEAETKHQLTEAFNKVMSKERGIGIVVTNDGALEKLDNNLRRNITNSVTPIVVVISEKDVAQENLRDMIKKAIGIDLMAK